MLAHSVQAQAHAQPTKTVHHVSQPVEEASRTAGAEDQVDSVAVEVQVEEEEEEAGVEEVVQLHAEEAQDREGRSRRGGMMDRSRLSRRLRSMLPI